MLDWVGLCGGIIVTSIRVVWWGSVVVYGCLRTTSPGRSWGALSKMWLSSRWTSLGVLLEIRGSVCWHMRYIESRILLCKSVLLVSGQVKKWSP